MKVLMFVLFFFSFCLPMHQTDIGKSASACLYHVSLFDDLCGVNDEDFWKLQSVHYYPVNQMFFITYRSILNDQVKQYQFHVCDTTTVFMRDGHLEKVPAHDEIKWDK